MNSPADFLAKCMNWWYRRISARRGLLTLVVMVLTVVLYLTSTGIRWQDNLLLFFPDSSPVVRDLEAAEQQPGLVDDLRVDVHFTQGQGDLAAAVAELKTAFEQTGQFAWVFGGVTSEQMLNAQENLQKLGPLLLDQNQIAEFKSRISTSWLDQHFAAVASQLGDPDGQILAEQLQHDPLDMEGLLSYGLGGANEFGGAHLENGLLVSADSRHAMMVLAPRFAPDDTSASEKMLQQLYAAVAAVQKQYPGLQVWVVGPYRNYVQNAQQVIRDVSMISILGTLLVAAAIWIYFRRVSTVLICMIPPALGFGAALGIAGILGCKLPLIVLAFGGLICGATTDYGIQLIAAINRRNRDGAMLSPDAPAAAARELFGPISMSVCTSVTGYAALALSDAPGLRQLGLFIAGATVCIWIATFIVLPAYLGTWVIHRRFVNTPQAVGETTPFWKRPMALASTGFVILTAFLIWHAAHVQYSYDAEALDVSSQELKQEQSQFFQVWGDLRHQALVVVNDTLPEQALTDVSFVSEILEHFARDHLIAGFASPMNLLPADEVLQEREGAWEQFWTPDEQFHFATLIAHAAESAGLRPAAFEDGISRLSGPISIEPARQRITDSPAALIPGLVTVTPRNVQIVTVVNLNENLPPAQRVAWIPSWRTIMPSWILPRVQIISGEVMLIDATDRNADEARKLFPWVALLILIPMWLYFRRPVLTLIAALSLAVGFVCLLGTAEWIGGGLNLLSLVPLLFTMGVAVDYGIYSASDPAQRVTKGQIRSRSPATFLCAMTTILGTGVMILAGHPMLHWIGLMLIAGIGGGYLASLLLVGPLVRWLFTRSSDSLIGHELAVTSSRIFIIIILICLAVMILLLNGCSTPAPPAYQPPDLPAPTADAVNRSLAEFPSAFDRQFFADLKVSDHEWSMVGRLNVASPESFRLTCATELGTLIFDASVAGNQIQVTKIASGVDESLPQNICRDLMFALDIPRNAVGVTTLGHTAEFHVTDQSGDQYTYIFAGFDGRLQFCIIQRPGEGRLEIRYEDYDNTGSPRGLSLWDPHNGFLWTLNFTDDQ